MVKQQIMQAVREVLDHYGLIYDVKTIEPEIEVAGRPPNTELIHPGDDWEDQFSEHRLWIMFMSKHLRCADSRIGYIDIDYDTQNILGLIVAHMRCSPHLGISDLPALTGIELWEIWEKSQTKAEMGMFKIIVPGWWNTESESDPRWNMSGEGMVGGFVMPDEAKKAVEAKKEELGEEPPKDLTYNYMKD